MRQYQRVFYHGAEWTFIEQVEDKYLLRSLNKNINDVLAEIGSVRPLVKERS